MPPTVRGLDLAQPLVSPGPAIGDHATTTAIQPTSDMVPAIVTPPVQRALVEAASSQVVVANRPSTMAGALPQVGVSMAGLTTIAALLSFGMNGPALVAAGVTALVQGVTLLAQRSKTTRDVAKLDDDSDEANPDDDVDTICARFEAAAREPHAIGTEGAEVSTTTAPETIEQLRKLRPFFDQQVVEASRWDSWDAEASSLQRCFSFLADRVKPLDSRFAAVIANSIAEACAAPKDREKVEDILRPAAAYISNRLQAGPVEAKSDLHQIGVMFDTKIREAMRWDNWRVEAKGLRRAFCYTIPLVAQHDPALGAFMRKSLDEADATNRWQEKAEDVLRPAAVYVSGALKVSD